MKINLLTDAPKHNLALMKISAYHKAQGDTVTLNEPQQPCDQSYGSWLFSQKYYCDTIGGPAIDPQIKLGGFEDYEPDYSLYPKLDYINAQNVDDLQRYSRVVDIRTILVVGLDMNVNNAEY